MCDCKPQKLTLLGLEKCTNLKKYPKQPPLVLYEVCSVHQRGVSGSIFHDTEIAFSNFDIDEHQYSIFFKESAYFSTFSVLLVESAAKENLHRKDTIINRHLHTRFTSSMSQ